MASILKPSQIGATSSSPRPVSFNVEDVQSRARDYLAEVQSEARQITAAAQAESEAIREAARQAGLEQANLEFEKLVQEAAQKLSDERCRTAIKTCEATVVQLSVSTAEWLAMWRNQTVELAAKIANKVVRRRMIDDDEVFRVWLEEALVAMRDARDLRVLVHPDDFALAGRFLQQLAKTVPQAASVEVVPDPEIELGGCVVRSNHGSIDQQLETQLARLVEQLA